MQGERCPPHPFHSPLRPGCTPPPPHAPPPPFVRTPGRGARAPPATPALPLCMHATEAQGTVPPPPPVRRQAPPPRLHVSPLHLGAPPPPHALLHACRKHGKDRGARKGRAAQGVSCARRPTRQGRTEHKGTAR